MPLRSPSQVSSHAQKFFDRQAAKKKGGNGMRASIHDLTTVAECDAIIPGRLKLNDATHLVTAAASATPSPSLTNSDASPFSQGRLDDAAIATANVFNDADACPFFSQGRSYDFSTATAETDVYARPSPSLINFDDSYFSQGRWNDAATATATATDAYARPSPSMMPFDASAFSQGRSNDAANIATTTTTDAFARASTSLIIFDDDASSQGRGQGSSPFNFK